ncbi:MAG: hypothetical protein HYT87_15815 [Nitrospirae bacterium]|nr:hypothetical protein [Nitrospirota bacterium]
MPYQDERGWIHFTPPEQTASLIDLLGRAYNNRHRDTDVKGLATLEEVKTALIRVSEALNEMGLPWGIAGGFAVGVRAKPRATFDVDVVVLAANFQDIKMAVARKWFDLSEERGEGQLGNWEGVTCQTLVGPYPSKVDVDIIFSGIDYFRSVLGRTTNEELLPGLQAPIISAEDLILLKLKSARPPDIGDAWRVFDQRRLTLDWAYLRSWADTLGVRGRLREFESEFGAP